MRLADAISVRSRERKLRLFLDELQRNPPQWLSDLRREGPHPRNVVAARLRISNSGLARATSPERIHTTAWFDSARPNARSLSRPLRSKIAAECSKWPRASSG